MSPSANDVNKQNVKSLEKLVFVMSAGPKFLENSGRYKVDKDGFDDSSGAGRR